CIYMCVCLHSMPITNAMTMPLYMIFYHVICFECMYWVVFGCVCVCVCVCVHVMCLYCCWLIYWSLVCMANYLHGGGMMIVYLPFFILICLFRRYGRCFLLWMFQHDA